MGTALCRSLVSEYEEVIGLIRGESDISTLESMSGVRLEEVPDQLDSLRRLLNRIEPGIIFHLATYYSRDDAIDVAEMIDSNVIFGAKLLAAATVIDGPIPRWVLTGSFFQHFEGNRALNLYASTKSAFRSIIDYYADAYRLCYAEVVLSDVYGAGVKRRKLVNVAIDAARSGTELQVPDGSRPLQLIHISDAVTAIEASARALLASRKNCGARWFASPDATMSIDEVLALVEKAVGRPIKRSDEPLDIPRQMDSFVTGTRPPGWVPRIDTEIGIAEMASS